MKRTRPITRFDGIENAILGNAQQAEAQFDRTRSTRTSLIEGLLEDIGCFLEEKPAAAETALGDDGMADELLAGAEALKEVQA